MEGFRFDGWTRRRVGVAGGGFIASLLALAAGDGEAKRKKRRKPKPKPKKGDFCTPAGAPCRTQGRRCAAKFCLKAPFTIEARWTEEADYDTFLFVPPQDATTGPAPYIDYTCDARNDCDTQYPFACSSGDEQESGSEIITVHQLLEGTYEYWMELYYDEAPGRLTIVLRDGNKRIVREWKSPVSSDLAQESWHVFDIDGATGTIATVDSVVNDTLPYAAHDPFTDVCP
jgi:hypothetical protein